MFLVYFMVASNGKIVEVLTHEGGGSGANLLSRIIHLDVYYKY